MSAKDRRKAFDIELDPALWAALDAHARAIGARSRAAAARDALRRPERVERAALEGAPPARARRPGRRRLRLQLEPDLRARLGLGDAADPAAAARLSALLRRALNSGL